MRTIADRGLLAAGAALVTLGLRLLRGLGFSCCQIHGTTVMRWCVIGLNIGGAADMGRDLRGDIIPFNPEYCAHTCDRSLGGHRPNGSPCHVTHPNDVSSCLAVYGGTCAAARRHHEKMTTLSRTTLV